jgi:DNA adenine methylase
MTYYEPFVGGGAALFGLRPSKAVACDMNSELMAAYRALKDDAGGLISRLAELARDISEKRYYEVRAMDRQEGYASLSDCERAARLIYLNRTCYNGLYRVNSRGLFNVPRGSYVDPKVLDEAALRAVSAYLRKAKVRLMCGDFAEAVKDAGEGSFVYFDPPYHAPDRNFTSYQSGGFGEDEQERLRDVFAGLAGRGARCLLSNADTPFVRDLYRRKGFKAVSVKAVRVINSRAAGRGKVGEVLIRNY